MREILFKAKTINGNWVNGLLANKNDKWYISNKAGSPFAYDVRPETICQFTGLTDKNGKKIWENDIFKFNDEVWESSYTSCGMEYDSWEVENYGVVGYYKETARYDFCRYKYNENSVEAELHENHDIEFADFVSGLEVIGNIFDDPELLQEGYK